ncbi:putative nuclease HARBI1 [Lineus longissimus]|uniref:putative nuclease HARBI1 n=1 Tax=Lineus longissimus TaxID=88925 RepID=UPI00315D4F58
MPGAIGALDCTHVKICKPGGRRGYGDEYINRKGVASINVQASCDAQERFTSIDANWPGSVHDSRIWKNSDVGRFVTKTLGDGHLLGDEGYGIAPWLMTPYGNPVQPHERTFNRIHKKERAVIERCFGQLKKRFPILLGQVRLRIPKVPSVVVACCVLHNAAKYLNDRDDDFIDAQDDDDEEGDEDDDDADLRIRHRGQERRRAISEILHDGNQN